MPLSDHEFTVRMASPPQSVKGVCYLISILALVFVSLPGYVFYIATTEGTLKRDAVTFGFVGVLAFLIVWCFATSVLLWKGNKLGLQMYSVLRVLLLVKRSFAATLDAELSKPDAVRYFQENA